MAHDPVNHPSHYTSHPSGIECITVTRHMGFNLGNVVKYLWRAGLKDRAPTLQDLKKARWYLDDEIQQLERVEAANALKIFDDVPNMFKATGQTATSEVLDTPFFKGHDRFCLSRAGKLCNCSASV